MKKNSIQTKKSFTRAEVEEHVKKMLTSAEMTICEQKDRILELKQEIDRLAREKAEKEEKLKMMQRGMNESERINKQAKKDASIQTKLIVEKVQQFGYKWKNYFTDLFAEIEKGKNATGLNTYNPENDFVITRDKYLEKLKSMSNKVAVDAPNAVKP